MARESHQNRPRASEELTQEKVLYLTFSSLFKYINAFDIATTSCTGMMDRNSSAYAAAVAAAYVPSFVLVRVGVVTDPTNHQARELVYQTGRFHLHVEHTQLLSE